MREWKLRHEIRIAPIFQAAGDVSRMRIGGKLNNFPLRCKCQQPVNRLLISIATQVADFAVKEVLLSVGEECILIDTVGPGSEKRVAAKLGLGFELADR